MDTSRKIEKVRSSLLECMSFTELAGCVSELSALVNASQTLVYQCLSPTELAFHGGSLEACMGEYLPFYSQDPVHPHMRSQGTRFLITHPPGWMEFNRSTTYFEFYRRRDVHYLLGARPTPYRYGEPGMFGFMFSRSRQQGDFDALALRALMQLELDLRAAWRRSDRTAELRRDAALLPLVAVQNAQSELIVLLDARGKLIWITPGAEKLWSQPGSNGLRQALAGAARDQLAPMERCDRRPLRGELAGIPVSCDLAVWRAGSDQPVCRARLSVDLAQRIATEHALTRAQATVLTQLARGKSNRAIAGCLHVSEHTVRSHLAQIRRKTGLRSRGEILARYAEIRFFDLR